MAWRELEREGREIMRGRLGGLVFSACFTVADYLLVSEVAQWPLTQRLADFSGNIDSPLETGCSAEPLILRSQHSDLGGTGQKGRQMHDTHTV